MDRPLDVSLVQLVTLLHAPIIFAVGNQIWKSHTCFPLGCRIKFQLPFNKIKWLSDCSRRWQVKG
jgi:hypothetical protein